MQIVLQKKGCRWTRCAGNIPGMRYADQLNECINYAVSGEGARRDSENLVSPSEKFRFTNEPNNVIFPSVAVQGVAGRMKVPVFAVCHPPPTPTPPQAGNACANPKHVPRDAFALLRRKGSWNRYIHLLQTEQAASGGDSDLEPNPQRRETGVCSRKWRVSWSPFSSFPFSDLPLDSRALVESSEDLFQQQTRPFRHTWPHLPWISFPSCILQLLSRKWKARDETRSHPASPTQSSHEVSYCQELENDSACGPRETLTAVQTEVPRTESSVLDRCVEGTNIVMILCFPQPLRITRLSQCWALFKSLSCGTSQSNCIFSSRIP